MEKIDKNQKTNSIAKAVRLIIDSNPFMKEAIVKNIINYSALAESIKKDVKKITNLEKPISKESLVASIIRYSKGLIAKSISKEIMKTISEVTFSVKSNIRLLSLPKKYIKKEDFLQIYKKFDVESEEILIVFQGIKDIILVADGPNFKFLKGYFANRLEILQENLALFIIHSEGIPQYIPGYLAFFTSKLAENGVNIEIYSSKEDLILIINENDVGRVYDILNNAKSESKKMINLMIN